MTTPTNSTNIDERSQEEKRCLNEETLLGSPVSLGVVLKVVIPTATLLLGALAAVWAELHSSLDEPSHIGTGTKQ
ncbi:MAG: hypothetical protein QM784_09800 [Polyangiaceae bacterium]